MVMREHTIGVIIPVYNSESLIGECLDSVTGQTSPFDEVIIVNDGSDDGSLAFCEQYAAEHPGIRILDRINAGPGAARNAGMELVKSDYFIFVDSDDRLAPTAVSVLLECVSRQDIDAVYFDLENSDISSYRMRVGLNHGDQVAADRDTVCTGSDMFSLLYPYGYKPVVWLALYKTELIHKSSIRFEEGVVFEDNLFTYRYMMEASRVICIPDRLYEHRCRAGSIIASPYSADKLDDHIAVNCSSMDYMISRGMQHTDIHLLYAGDMCKLCVQGYIRCIDTGVSVGSPTVDMLKGLLLRYLSLFDADTVSSGSLSMDNKIVFTQIWYFCRHMKFVDAGYMTDHAAISQMPGQVRSFYDDLYDRTMLGDESARVGIYCVGQNTIQMEGLFERLYGSPKAGIVYIDTVKAGEEYRHKRIFSYDEVQGTMDCVVVSRICPMYDLADRIRNESPGIKVCDIGAQADTSLFTLGRFMFIDHE